MSAPKETKEAAKEAPVEGKKKGAGLVIGLVACNVLSLGGLGAFVLLSGRSETATAAPSAPDAKDDKPAEGHDAPAEKAEGGHEAPENTEAPAEHGAEKPATSKGPARHEEGSIITVSLGSYVINLNDPIRFAYLKAGLSAEVAGEGIEAEMKSRDPQIRDAVISYLSSLNLKDTQGSVAKANIRDNLRQRLNNIIANGEVKQVYLTEFVTQ